MTTSHRKRKSSSSRWLRKAKRLFLAFISPRKTLSQEQLGRKRKRRKRRKSQSQPKSLREILSGFILLLRTKKRRRRKKKKSLVKKIYLSWLKFAQNCVQWNQKLLTPQKRRRRRRKKQYAVYVMGHQKKIP
jgi:hypothetical protein